MNSRLWIPQEISSPQGLFTWTWWSQPRLKHVTHSDGPTTAALWFYTLIYLACWFCLTYSLFPPAPQVHCSTPAITWHAQKSISKDRETGCVCVALLESWGLPYFFLHVVHSKLDSENELSPQFQCLYLSNKSQTYILATFLVPFKVKGLVVSVV